MEVITIIKKSLFLLKYRKKLHKRYSSFAKAITLAIERKVTNIIETGTARDPEGWKGDGLSTILFGDYCRKFNARLVTCDISEKNIQICKELTKKFKSYITYIIDDSVHFLKNYPYQIDFLYLDSLDSTEENVKQAQEHNLAEVQSAEDKLHSKSIILIDDYSKDPDKGKGALSVPYLQSKGWKLVHDSVQALLIKEE